MFSYIVRVLQPIVYPLALIALVLLGVTLRRIALADIESVSGCSPHNAAGGRTMRCGQRTHPAAQRACVVAADA